MKKTLPSLFLIILIVAIFFVSCSENEARTSVTLSPEPTITNTSASTFTLTTITTYESASTLSLVSITINPVDNASMVHIPAGEFEMGSLDGDKNMLHTVNLDEYWIYQTEVTNAQYGLCISEGDCDKPPSNLYFNDSRPQYPMVDIDWFEAAAYCEWAGGRLPTEAEWEKAARGGLAGLAYPWGDEAPDCTTGARNGAQFQDCDGETLPVGSFAPNGYGLYDMAGNVWEWLGDWYDENYYQDSPYQNPQGPDSGTYRVVRGGSESSSEYYLSVSFREGYLPTMMHGHLGFRCVISP